MKKKTENNPKIDRKQVRKEMTLQFQQMKNLEITSAWTINLIEIYLKKDLLKRFFDPIQ